MNRVSHYLFVYGTLKKGGSRHRLLARPGIRCVGHGQTRGRLYSLPGRDYPAAVCDDGPSHVQGEIYEIEDRYAQQYLGDLDLEEGVDEGLYARVLREIAAAGKTVNAWVYTYQQAVNEAFVIPTGVFPL